MMVPSYYKFSSNYSLITTLLNLLIKNIDLVCFNILNCHPKHGAYEKTGYWNDK